MVEGVGERQGGAVSLAVGGPPPPPTRPAPSLGVPRPDGWRPAPARGPPRTPASSRQVTTRRRSAPSRPAASKAAATSVRRSRVRSAGSASRTTSPIHRVGGTHVLLPVRQLPVKSPWRWRAEMYEPGASRVRTDSGTGSAKATVSSVVISLRLSRTRRSWTSSVRRGPATKAPRRRHRPRSRTMRSASWPAIRSSRRYRGLPRLVCQRASDRSPSR